MPVADAILIELGGLAAVRNQEIEISIAIVISHRQSPPYELVSHVRTQLSGRIFEATPFVSVELIRLRVGELGTALLDVVQYVSVDHKKVEVSIVVVIQKTSGESN